MSRGVIDTIQLGATMTVVVPVVYLGGDFLLRGRVLPGTGFLVLAALMLIVEEYVVRPGDVPLEGAKRLVGLVAGDDDRE